MKAGGDYCLAVKGNQETLFEDMKAAFLSAMETDFTATSHQEVHTADKGHGRVEERHYYTMPVPTTLRTAQQWKGLQSIGMTITYRSKDCDGELRYYINSFACNAE